MKVFISQNMGNSIDELEKEIEFVKKEVEENYEENVIVAIRPAASKRVMIKLPCACDGVWFGDGWKESADCELEHNIARAKGIKILHD